MKIKEMTGQPLFKVVQAINNSPADFIPLKLAVKNSVVLSVYKQKKSWLDHAADYLESFGPKWE